MAQLIWISFMISLYIFEASKG